MKRRLKPLFLFFLLMGLTVLVSMPAYAANHYELKDINGKTIYIPLTSKKYDLRTPVRWDGLGKLDTESLKYNKKALSVETYPDYTYMYILPKKIGTYNFSFKLKKAGKKTEYTFKVKVFKLTKLPFTSIKYGSRTIKLDYSMKYTFSEGPLGSNKLFKAGTVSAKFKIALRKGWSVKSAVLTHNGKSKKVSLNKKVTYKSLSDFVTFTFEDKNHNLLEFRLHGALASG